MEFLKTYKKKIILTVLAVILAAAGYFGMNVPVNVQAIISGDLSGIGAVLEGEQP